jgi:hypothetical protein
MGCCYPTHSCKASNPTSGHCRHAAPPTRYGLQGVGDCGGGPLRMFMMVTSGSGPHLHRDWAQLCHICAGTGLTPLAFAPGPGRTRGILARGLAAPPRLGSGLTPATSASESGLAPCHICGGTGSPLPHLHRDWAHPSHICAATRLIRRRPGVVLCRARRRGPSRWCLRASRRSCLCCRCCTARNGPSVSTPSSNSADGSPCNHGLCATHGESAFGTKDALEAGG